MGSLNEEENTIWGNIKKLGLKNALWDMIRRRFGFLSEHPTLKKLFLSFIVTHIDRNGSIALESYEQKVSDEKLVIADSTSDEPEERIQEVILTISSDIKNKTYNIIGIDNNPKTLQKEIFEIPVVVDIPITDDF